MGDGSRSVRFGTSVKAVNCVSHVEKSGRDFQVETFMQCDWQKCISVKAGYSKRLERSGRDFQRETSVRCLARSASVKAANTVNSLRSPGGAISANAGFAVRSARFYMRKNSCACEWRFRLKEFRRDFVIANCRAISRDECRTGRHKICFHSRCYCFGLKSHGGIF